jgi:hypothetical protein
MSDMVPAGYIHDDWITRMEWEVIYISKVLFSSSFKLYFNNIKLIKLRDTHLGEPIKRIHFIAITRAAGAIVLASSSTSRGGGA